MSNQIAKPLLQIETEIEFYKTQFANNTIEIGKRLIEAKAQLQHGEWTNWLKEKVEFSNTTAKRFMQVAREFSNSPTLGDLPRSKVFALLDVPVEDREQFISEPHQVNGQTKTVDEMTTRELQKVIAEKKALEEKALMLEKDKNETINAFTEKVNSKDEEINKLKEQLKPSEPIIVEKEIIKEVIPDDYEKLKKENDGLLKSYTTLYEAKKKIEDELISYKNSSENSNFGTPIDITNIVDFRYAMNEFLRKVGAVAYGGELFRDKQPSEMKKWYECIEYLQRFLDDLKAATMGNAVGANVIYLKEEEC